MLYTYCSACVAFYVAFIFLVYMSFVSGHIGWAFAMGLCMALGHLAGHAGNHWAVSKHDWVNRFMSVTCTSLWGLREKNWETSESAFLNRELEELQESVEAVSL